MKKTIHTVDQYGGERGFSLVIVLFFVGLIAAIIAMNAMGKKGAVQEDQARAAGWHLAQVAKAARVYVRNNSLDSGDTYHKSRLNAGGIVIPLDDIEAAGLLPPNFPDTNVLGQRITVYAANFPIDAALADQVANAYVHLSDTPETRTKPVLMQYLLEGAKENGLFAKAPIFDGNNDNISESCGSSGPAYVLWDTNCLGLADYNRVTALSSFQPGSLMVPAWRSQNLDTRAVMRFPQPENPGFATMLTSLELAQTHRNADGDCTRFEQVRDYNNTADPNAMLDTDLCDVRVHDAAGNDRRFDMINISSMEVNSIVAANQGANDVSTRYDASGAPVVQTEYSSLPGGGQRTMAQNNTYNEVMVVTGNVSTAGNVWATGRQNLPGAPTVAFMDDAGDGTALLVDKNITVKNGGDPVANPLVVRVTDTASVSMLRGTSLDNENGVTTVAGTAGANQIIANTVSMPDGACPPGAKDCGMVTQTITAGNDIDATSANFFSGVSARTLEVTAPQRPGNPGVPALVVHGLKGNGTTVVRDDMRVGVLPGSGGGLVVDGNTVIRRNLSLNICDGAACPNITEDPQDGIIYE